MVFVERGDIPRFISNYDHARHQAIRLSQINPTKEVLLVEYHHKFLAGKKI